MSKYVLIANIHCFVFLIWDLNIKFLNYSFHDVLDDAKSSSLWVSKNGITKSTRAGQCYDIQFIA